MGYSGPATMPWITRKPTSSGIDREIPQRNEASTNNKVAQRNSLTSPNRRLSQPVSGNAMALLTANEVITHVPCSELTPRLPAMVGKATLAMVVSSTCMKTASDRPMVHITKLGGVKEAGAFALIANPTSLQGAPALRPELGIGDFQR